MAEDLFARLYGTIQYSGFTDPEMLKSRSPYTGEDGQRYLKRLSEIRRHEGAHGLADRDIQDYSEDNAFVQLFGYKVEVPADRIDVYRGVSRADAGKLRPGDFVTPSRSYARSYVRGKFGRIVKETVNTDDLLVMKIGDEDMLEFVYYPRSAMSTPRPSSGDVKPPYTFRQFWAEVNGHP
jgi:hypothetical protein